MTATKSNWRILTGGLRGLWLVGIVLATLECASRVDDLLHYDAPLLGRYEFDQLFHNTDRGPRGVPFGRYMHWRLSSAGLRSPEIDTLSAGRVRIVAYGASETFGIYEDDGKEFPRVLEADLNKRGAGPLDVINAGLPGMRVGSGISLLRELKATAGPILVVIYPTPTHYIGVTRPYCERKPLLTSANESAWPQLRIIEKSKDQFKRAAPPAGMTWLRKFSISVQMRNKKLLDRVEPTSLSAFAADLNCAVNAARELGMTPILVTHANRFDGGTRADDPDGLTKWRLQYPELREEGFIDLERRANDVVRQLAQQERVPLVDAATQMGGQPKWFADHAHFNNEGAAQMAAILAPAIASVLSDQGRQIR